MAPHRRATPAGAVMARRMVAALAIVVAYATLSLPSSGVDAAIVTARNPKKGSVKGGTLLRLTGSGFSRDGQDGSTQVFLGTKECVVDEYLTTDTNLVCRTPEHEPQLDYPLESGVGWSETVQLQVAIVSVDSVGFASISSSIDDYRFDTSYTPWLFTVDHAVLAGQVMDFYGKLIRDDVGDFDVRIGEHRCDVDEDINDYPIVPYDWGTGHCIVAEQVAGYYNVSMHVSGDGGSTGYGLAAVNDAAWRVSPEGDEVFMTEQVAHISGVSQLQAGKLGRAEITIYGAGFSTVAADNVVRAGGRDCEVVSSTRNTITCVLSADVDEHVHMMDDDENATDVGDMDVGDMGMGEHDMDSGKRIPGGRGMLKELFYSISGSHGNSFANTAAYPHSPHVPESTIGGAQWLGDHANSAFQHSNYYITRLTALFTAPVSTNYSFWVKGDDYVSFSLSTDEDPANLRMLAEAPSYMQHYWYSESQMSEPVWLEAGQKYFAEVRHYEASGYDWANVAMRIHNHYVPPPPMPEEPEGHGGMPMMNMTNCPGNATIDIINGTMAGNATGMGGAVTHNGTKVNGTIVVCHVNVTDDGEMDHDMHRLLEEEWAAGLWVEGEDYVWLTDGDYVDFMDGYYDPDDWDYYWEHGRFLEDANITVGNMTVANMTMGNMTMGNMTMANMTVHNMTAHNMTADDGVHGGHGGHDEHDHEEEEEEPEEPAPWETTPLQRRYNSIWEQQHVSISPDIQREKQRITIVGASVGSFVLRTRTIGNGGIVNDDLSDELDWDASTSTVTSRVKQVVGCSSISVSRSAVYYRPPPVAVLIEPEEEEVTDPNATAPEPQYEYIEQDEILGGYSWDITMNCASNGYPLIEVVNTGMFPMFDPDAPSLDWTSERLQGPSEMVSGSFTMTVNGETTGDIAYDFNEWEVELELEMLEGINNVEVTDAGSPSDGRTWYVTFIDPPDVPPVELDYSLLSGENVTMSVHIYQDGSYDALYDPIPGSLFELPRTTTGIEVWTHGFKAACPTVHPPVVFAGDEEGIEEDVDPRAPVILTAGDDPCYFVYNHSLTPMLTSITPRDVTVGDTLTIAGTGFLAGEPQLHDVSLNGTACNVTSATATELECTVADSFAGTLFVEVIVGRARGLAMVDEHDPTTHTVGYAMVVDSVARTRGSLGGGTRLHINGTGFHTHHSLHGVTQVTVGGVECAVLAVTPAFIECDVPTAIDVLHFDGSDGSCTNSSGGNIEPEDAASGADLYTMGATCSGSIVVGAVETGEMFEHTTPLTPTLDTLVPSQATVAATHEMTLSGSALNGLAGDVVPEVHFDDRRCTISPRLPGDLLPSPDDDVRCTLLRHEPWGHAATTIEPRVYVFPLGDAVLMGGDSSVLSTGFHISGVSPRVGSLAGGTTLTIAGTYFGMHAHMHTVTLEVAVPMTEEELAAEQDHDGHGDHQEEEMDMDDMNMNDHGGHGDHEDEDEDDELDGGHEQEMEGHWLYSILCEVQSVTLTELVCTVESTPEDIMFSGEDLDAEVKVVLNSFEAVCHGEESCAYTLATDATPELNYTVVEYAPVPPLGEQTTPSILNISGIRFDGEGVHGIEVIVGDRLCAITVHEEDFVQCEAPEHKAGDLPIVILVHGFGLARVWDAAEAVYEYPLRVDWLSTTNSSWAGGLHVEVLGVGFAEETLDNLVEFLASARYFGAPFDVPNYAFVLEASHTRLLVRSPPVTLSGSYDYPRADTVVTVSVVPHVIVDESAEEEEEEEDNGGGHGDHRVLMRRAQDFANGVGDMLSSEAPMLFHYDYSLEYTPVVFSTLPASGVAGDTLTVTGSSLGDDLSAAEVSIAGEACTYEGDSAGPGGAQRVACTVGNSPAGRHLVLVRVPGKGYARSRTSSEASVYEDDAQDAGETTGVPGVDLDNLGFTSLLAVTSLSDNVGSLGGGWPLKLHGTGFPASVGDAAFFDATVNVCGKMCHVTASDYDTLTCATHEVRTAGTLAAFPDVFAIDVPFRHTSDVREPLHGSTIYENYYSGDRNAAFDGDVESRSRSYNWDNCWIGIDLGEAVQGVVYRIRYFPEFANAGAMLGGRFEGKVDDSEDGEYEVIGVVEGRPHEAWNWIDVKPFATDDGPATPKAYRYLRYVGATNSRCALNEIEFIGVTVSADTRTYVAPGSPESDAACNATIAVAPDYSAQYLGGVPGVVDAVPPFFPEWAAPVTSNDLALFQAAATPVVTGITPNNASSLGGVPITIFGSGFNAADAEGHTVILSGYPCDVVSATADEIECVTQERGVELHEATVEVNVPGSGTAFVELGVQFRYLDRWSWLSSWYHSDFEPPVTLDSVVLPAGQNILLDVSPPEMFLFLIQGTLVFDRTDLELEAWYLLVQGGRLEIGTEEDPFLQKATITMHGDRYKNVHIPHMGAKMVAVTNKVINHHQHMGELVPESEMGFLEIHGAPRKRTWTKLSETVYAGEDILKTSEEVDFMPGDQLVVTSSTHSSSGYEEVEVAELIDPNTIRLVAPMATTHESFWYYPPEGAEGYNAVDMRIEVALLTRNVVIQGDEKSEDQLFGVHTISVHGGTFRIENTELRRCGQFAVLGRYCTHLHMVGFATQSYIRANSIHHSFQRAVTIHGSYLSHIQHNVAFTVRGHTFFVEDGIERRNVIEGNLGINTIPCSSCLSSDTKPATFWTTTPNNIWRSNVAAGSKSFGFWFELPGHPGGPSFTTSECPNHGHLGEFFNNTAHSNNGNGLRIYPHWSPYNDPCNSNSGARPTFTYNFTGFSNGIGIFHNTIGSIHHVNAHLVNNAGDGVFWEKHVNAPYGDIPHFIDPLIVASLNYNPNFGGHAIWCPQNEFVFISGATVVNFGERTGAFAGCNKCGSHTDMKQGGYTVRFEKLRFINSPKRVDWTPPYKQIFFDLDGTLTGEVNGTVTPYRAFNHWEPICTQPPLDEGGVDVYESGLVCDSHVRVRRVSIDGVEPRELDWQRLRFISEVGEENVDFLVKDSYGWVTPLVNQHTYHLEWQSLVDFRDLRISYSRVEYVDEFVDEDLADMVHQGVFPEGFRIGGEPSEASPARRMWKMMPGVNTSKVVSVAATQHAPEWVGFGTTYIDTRWQYETVHNDRYIPWNDDRPPLPTDPIGTGHTAQEPNQTFSIMINSVNSSVGTASPTQYEWSSARYTTNSHALQCPPDGCPVPPPPTVGNATRWSDPMSWPHYDFNVPSYGMRVTIPHTAHILLDIVTPILGHIVIEGRLEFEDLNDVALHASGIEVWGDLVIGTAAHPFQHNAEIVMYGQRNWPTVVVDNSLFLGNKMMVVLGNVEVHGRDRDLTWTRLAEPVFAGDDLVTLVGDLSDWAPGEEIAITPTEYDTDELERHTIRSVSVSGSGDGATTTVELEDPVTFAHFQGTVFTDDGEGGTGRQVVLAAAVGVLTRNVVFRPDLFDEDDTYGAHIYVAEILREPASDSRAGSAVFRHMEFRDCGKMGMEHAAINYQYLNNVPGPPPVNVLDGCSMTNTFNYGIVSFGGDNLVIKRNVIHKAHRSAIDIDIRSTNITLTDNLVAGTRRSPDDGASAWTRPIASFFVDTPSVFRMTGNVAAGSVDLGYAVRPPVCGADDNVFNHNEAHGNLVGVFLLNNRASNCITLGGATVWKNAHIGIAGIDMQSSLVLSRIVSADNHIGIVMNFLGVGSGNNAFSGASNEATNYATLQDSIVLGSTLASSCDASLTCRASSQNDPAGASDVCGSVFGPAYRRVGLLWSQWTNRGKTCDTDVLPVCRPPNTVERLCALPWELRYGLPSVVHARVNVRRTVFAHWAADDCGLTSKAVAFNPSQIDYAPPMYMSSVRWVDVPHAAQLQLARPEGQSQEEDSYNYIFIDDETGELTGTPGGAVLGNNAPLTRPDPACVSMLEEWGGGYSCPSQKMVAMILESMDSDRGGRNIGPIRVHRETPELGNRTWWAVGPYADMCAMRMPFAQFPFLVEEGYEYDMTTTNTPPAKLRLHFFSDDPDDAILVKLFRERPEKADVFVGGVQVPEQELNEATIRMPTLDDPAGFHMFDPHARTLYFVMRGGGGPGSHVYDIRRTNVVALTLVLEVDVHDFFEEDLVTNLALLLQIDASRIKIVGVRVGSVVVDFEISDDAPPSVDNTETAAAVQRLQVLTERIIELAQTGELDVGYQVAELTIVPPRLDEVPPEPEDGEDPAPAYEPFTLVPAPLNSRQPEDTGAVPTPDDDLDPLVIVGIAAGVLVGGVCIWFMYHVVNKKRREAMFTNVFKVEVKHTQSADEGEVPAIRWEADPRPAHMKNGPSNPPVGAGGTQSWTKSGDAVSDYTGPQAGNALASGQSTGKSPARTAAMEDLGHSPRFSSPSHESTDLHTESQRIAAQRDWNRSLPGVHRRSGTFVPGEHSGHVGEAPHPVSGSGMILPSVHGHAGSSGRIQHGGGGGGAASSSFGLG